MLFFAVNEEIYCNSITIIDIQTQVFAFILIKINIFLLSSTLLINDSSLQIRSSSVLSRFMHQGSRMLMVAKLIYNLACLYGFSTKFSLVLLTKDVQFFFIRLPFKFASLGLLVILWGKYICVWRYNLLSYYN